MNNLAKTLLSGAALCVLTAAAANAQRAPAFHLTALHGGRVVNKTKLHNLGATHVTYTFGNYTSVSESSDFRQTVRFDAFGACGFSSDKVKAPRKTEYAKIGIYTETSTSGCGAGVPLVLVGPTYKLTNPNGAGHTDSFVLSTSAKFKQNGTKYKGTVNLEYFVSIE